MLFLRLKRKNRNRDTFSRYGALLNHESSEIVNVAMPSLILVESADADRSTLTRALLLDRPPAIS